MKKTTPYNELDMVAPFADIAASGEDAAVSKGTPGTIVSIAFDGSCLVEFCDGDGRTLAMHWLQPDDVRLTWKKPTGRTAPASA